MIFTHLIYAYLLLGAILTWGVFHARQLKTSTIRGFLYLLTFVGLIIYLEIIDFIPNNFYPFQENTPLWFIKLLAIFPNALTLILLITIFFLLICTPTLLLHCLLYISIHLFKKIKEKITKDNVDSYLPDPNFSQESETIAYPQLFKAYQIFIYPLIYALYPALILGNTLIVCFFLFKPEQLPLGISISGIISVLSYAFSYQQFVKVTLYAENKNFVLPYTASYSKLSDSKKTKDTPQNGDNSSEKIAIAQETTATLKNKAGKTKEVEIHQPLPEIDQKNFKHFLLLNNLLMRIPQKRILPFLRFSLCCFLIIRFSTISHNPFISVLSTLTGLSLIIILYQVYKKSYDDLWIYLLSIKLSPKDISPIVKTVITKGTTPKKEIYIIIYYSVYYSIALSFGFSLIILSNQLFNTAYPLLPTLLNTIPIAIHNFFLFFLPALPICYCLRYFLLTLFDSSKISQGKNSPKHDQQLRANLSLEHKKERDTLNQHNQYSVSTIKQDDKKIPPTPSSNTPPKDQPIYIPRTSRRDTYRRGDSVHKNITEKRSNLTNSEHIIYYQKNYTQHNSLLNPTHIPNNNHVHQSAHSYHEESEGDEGEE